MNSYKKGCGSTLTTPCYFSPKKTELEQTAQAEIQHVITNEALHIILLDGTWKQAARMANLSPWLQNIPRLTLSNIDNKENTDSSYIRKSLSPHQLSTAQSAARVLQQYGETENALALDHYFSVFNQHCLATRANKAPTISDSHHYLHNMKNLTL